MHVRCAGFPCEFYGSFGSCHIGLKQFILRREMPDIRRAVIYHGHLVCKPCEVLVIQSEMFLGEAADYRNQKVLMLPAEFGAEMPPQ